MIRTRKMSEKSFREKWNTMLVIIVSVLLQSNTGRAASYTVGDSKGWTFNVAGWENGKKFNAGDVLVFKYSPSAHNVVVVDKSSYDSCSPPKNARTYNSGNDRITLKKGVNYFICSIAGHCKSGMKIAAGAA